MKETDVAAPVVEYLRELGWRPYQEVQLDRGGDRADIVATHGDRIVWIIEAKVSLSWELIEQALRWRPMAHRISIAVPAPKRGVRGIERRVVAMLGLGLFEGDTETVAPRFSKPVRGAHGVHAILGALCSLQECGVAPVGTNRGGHATPFQRTLLEMAEAVRDAAAPMTTKELVAAVTHHYASNRSAAGNLVAWAGSIHFARYGLRAAKGARGFEWTFDPALAQLVQCESKRYGRCQMATDQRCPDCGAAVCETHRDAHGADWRQACPSRSAGGAS